MQQNRPTRRLHRRTADEKRALLDALAASGLSVRAFLPVALEARAGGEDIERIIASRSDDCIRTCAHRSSANRSFAVFCPWGPR